MMTDSERRSVETAIHRLLSANQDLRLENARLRRDNDRLRETQIEELQNRCRLLEAISHVSAN